ncbi:MAG: family 20 glycosylhydrolase [Lentisphaeria bacterium]|nr:family 20 glycosylhydrolase [Lentisphaeria bacterium]
MKHLNCLWPYPQKLTLKGQTFTPPQTVALRGEPLNSRLINDLRQIAGLELTDDDTAFPITYTVCHGMRPEHYTLDIVPDGVIIEVADLRALGYAIQMLVQIALLARSDGGWPCLHIEDWPTFAKRAAMIDMGRSVFPMPMLKRLVRVYSRLRYNQLHLRLFDDELCGVRFEGLPFGSENPYAISLAELAELVSYAGDYGMEVVPEIETWGHVTSIVHHRPELRGGEGMYAGSSFLICPETIDLVRQLTEQVVSVMPSKATIHLGFDEAKWFLAPTMPAGFQPEDLLLRYDDMLQELGAQHGKRLTMQIWADHAGRAVAESMRDRVILQPWQYWNALRGKIDEAVERYSGEDKPRWMMGVGQSMAQYRGAYHATRHFTQQAIDSSNLDGLTVCLWGWNDISRMFISLFAGAYFAWNPRSPAPFADTEDYENFDRHVFPIMCRWQSTFRDAFPDELDADRGPLVRAGWHMWGKRHGQPVAPTVVASKTEFGHDYLTE